MSMDVKVKSVKELTNEIKCILEERFPYVWVKGELGPVKLHSSGHRYFSLKEEDYVINGICWRGTPLAITLEEGKIVECYAKVTIFGGRSSYQIIAKEIREVSSKGDILFKLEELKKKLIAEGVFAIKQNEVLSEFPKNIAILTSPTGAVLHDMMHRINDRFPCVNVHFIPINVQGVDAQKSILDGLLKAELLNVELVILARGGGSLEDLWIFNDELVVRKVATLNKPIITAIGHETDTTLVDYASSLRAPTPTAAIELSLPDKDELIKNILTNMNLIVFHIQEKLKNMKNFIDQFSDVKMLMENFIESFYQKLDNALLSFCDLLKTKMQEQEVKLLDVNFNDFLHNIQKYELDFINFELSIKERINNRLIKYEEYVSIEYQHIKEREKLLQDNVILLSNNKRLLSVDDVKNLNKECFSINFHDGSVVVVEK